jgi:predicted  nucleic acid-binding Zn-ribbon protein
VFLFLLQSLDGKASIGETLRPKPERNASETDENSAAVAAVERTMKKYADNLMRVLEDMRGKLTQLERTTDRLESTVAELQNRSADHHGEVDGRVRGLEHVLREVGTELHGRMLLERLSLGGSSSCNNF